MRLMARIAGQTAGVIGAGDLREGAGLGGVGLVTTRANHAGIGQGRLDGSGIVSVPATLCARVPEGVPLQAAAFATIAAIPLHAIRVAETRLGDQVAVIVHRGRLQEISQLKRQP